MTGLIFLPWATSRFLRFGRLDWKAWALAGGAVGSFAVMMARYGARDAGMTVVTALVMGAVVVWRQRRESGTGVKAASR